MDPSQIEALQNLYRVVSENQSKLRGSLPEGTGAMDRVGRPLAITIRDILAAHGDCTCAGLGAP